MGWQKYQAITSAHVLAFTCRYLCQPKLLFSNSLLHFFLNFYLWKIEFTNETCNKIIVVMFLTMKATILDTHGRSKHKQCNGVLITFFIDFIWQNIFYAKAICKSTSLQKVEIHIQKECLKVEFIFVTFKNLLISVPSQAHLSGCW